MLELSIPFYFCSMICYSNGTVKLNLVHSHSAGQLLRVFIPRVFVNVVKIRLESIVSESVSVSLMDHGDCDVDCVGCREACEQWK